MVKKHIKDITVQETNDSSILSKASIVELGYFNDPFLKLFCKRIARRSPLIHRGYYIRAMAIDHVLKSFLNNTQGQLQIISLGAGFDTSYFRLKSQHRELFANRCRYIEVDFPDVVKRKQELVMRNEALVQMIGEFSICTQDGELDSKDYNIVPCDLTDLKRLEKMFSKLHIQLDTPTLFFSECVLTYVDYEQANNLLQWIQAMFPNCVLAIYEQYCPSDPFGVVMMNHFNKIQSPLKRINQLNTLQKHKELLSSFHFDSAISFNMNYFFERYVSNEEKERMMNLEVFDEYEEWHLKCSHYCIAAGFQGDCNVQAKLMFPYTTPPIDEQNMLPAAELETIDVCRNSPSVMRFGHCVTKLTNNRYLINGGFGMTSSGGHKRLRNGIVFTVETTGEVLFSEKFEMPERMYHSTTEISENVFFIFGGRLSPMTTAGSYGIYKMVGDSSSFTALHQSILDSSKYCPKSRWRHSSVLFKECNFDARNIYLTVTLCGSDAGYFEISDLVLVYGGIGAENEIFDDFWSFNTSNFEWKKIETSKPLLPRHTHSMNIWRDRCIIYGGLNKKMEALNALTVITPKEDVFDVEEEVPINIALPNRYSHSSHVVNDKLIVIGGIEPSAEYEPPIIIISLITKQWQEIALPTCNPEQPLMLHNHGHVVDETGCMLIVGGGGNCFSFGTHLNKHITSFNLNKLIETTEVNSQNTACMK